VATRTSTNAMPGQGEWPLSARPKGGLLKCTAPSLSEELTTLDLHSHWARSEPSVWAPSELRQSSTSEVSKVAQKLKSPTAPGQAHFAIRSIFTTVRTESNYGGGI
jgi:hypothetical protein